MTETDPIEKCSPSLMAEHVVHTIAATVHPEHKPTIKPTPVLTYVPTVITTLPPNPNVDPNPQLEPVPVCKGPNEIWKIASNCGNFCQNLCCRPCCIVNKRANWQCDCKDGCSRNSDGKCIEINSPECMKEMLRTRQCKTFDCGTIFPIKISKRPTILEF